MICVKYSGIDLEIEKNGKGPYYSKNKIICLPKVQDFLRVCLFSNPCLTDQSVVLNRYIYIYSKLRGCAICQNKKPRAK